MENVYKRSEPRMLYRAPVWLKASDAVSSLVGETRNLSRRGMFVNIVPTPPLGTELLCELPGRREVRGRVAWVCRPEASELMGVGIEFADRSEAAMVEELVGVRLDEDQPMNVWFAGLASPTRSTGQVTHEGIELSTTLDFLRVGSEVSVAAPRTEEAIDDPRLRGRISRVSLDTESGQPRLAISLAVVAERAKHELEPDDERWFPDIVVVEEEMIAAEVHAIAANENTLEDEASFAAIADALEIAPPVADPLHDAIARDAVAYAAAPVSHLVAVETGIIAYDATAPISVLDEATERTVMDELVAPVPQAQTSRRARGMLFAGVVMVALVGLVALRLVSLGKDAEPIVAAPVVQAAPPAEEPAEVTPPSTEEPTAAATPEPTPIAAATPVAVAAPVAKPAPVAAAAPVAKPAPVAATAAPAPAADPGAWHPQVVHNDDRVSLVVPIGGSSRGLSTFTLTDPPGLAVDLPSARAGTPMKPYLLHDAAFHSLWVRTRPAGGLQIRLHVARGTHVAADVVNGTLRFRTR